MKNENLLLSGFGIIVTGIVAGVVIDRAISRGNLVRLKTPVGSLSFNEDNNRTRRIKPIAIGRSKSKRLRLLS